MGGILTILHSMRDHWSLCLLIISSQAFFWVAGYLRGFRSGEDSEIERKSRNISSLARSNEQLRQKIDFLQAENDSLQRRINPVMKMRDATHEALGLVGRLDPIPGKFISTKGPTINKEVLKALGPSEPPTPPNHKEVG
jgi:hypothetical protein